MAHAELTYVRERLVTMSETKTAKTRGRTKGVYGDRSRLKKSTILMAVGILVFIIFLVAYGIFKSGSRKNIFTIMAILSVLPFAKLCSILSTMLPYKSMPAQQAAQLMELAGDMQVVYDVIFATEKTVYPIDCMVIEEGMALVFSPVQDKKKDGLQKALKSFFHDRGYARFSVRIESDYEQFKEMFARAASVQHKNRATQTAAEAFLINCV